MTFATLYTKETNARTTGILTVAKLNNLDLDVKIVNPAEGLTAEQLKINPIGKVPFMIQPDGFKLSECMAIAIYLASQNEKTTLLGESKQQYAEIIKWMSFANTEIMTPLASWFRPLRGLEPYNKKNVDLSEVATLKAVSILDSHLLLKTYLVGERITLADYFTAGICARGFEYVFDKGFRAKFPSFTRWWATIANQTEWCGIHEFIDEAIKYTPPAKPAKEPKPAKAAPAAKAPKKEEAEEEDDAPPPPPKPKHPLEALGKPTLVLDDWKRVYSNQDTRESALPWFWENYKPDEYSLYRIDYKYNDELTQIFKTSNLIGGLFNRLEASRKYLFGCTSVYGENNDSIVRGVFLVRGQEWEPAFNVAPDYESYKFTKLDPSKPEDKEFIGNEWSWDVPAVVNGKDYAHADGKVFK